MVILVLIQSCESNDEIHLAGQWKLIKVKEGKVIEPFKLYCPTSYPEYYPCEEIIYVTEDKIEHPLMFSNQGFRIEDKFISYELGDGMVRFIKDSMNYEYNYTYSNNKICFDDGQLCFEKDSRKSIEIDSTIFKFKVAGEFSYNYTLWMNYNYMQDGRTCEIWIAESGEDVQLEMDNSEMDYVLKLLERIPEKDLNKIYNNGMSDCVEISIDFYTSKGNYKGIETCDMKGENTFEIRALITNMFWIMQKYLKRE